ncbi:nicotinamide-nucleotide adenylyltransferase [Candidatus Nitrososphaera gargensis Ga9.2]|uniref:Nicotinamide-nucleotide adenylyltransferase n=1 Tax=Nitrososphaera gargensis (strain Ga9.2) TaxID=1237085 RepID=K0IFK6_NITGG|nr:nicotinamide-nucleotide adenylyltransferase [Candidatus Nitrososphaera gargensis]AFU60146.1 nicotinamide-nucleotide adenylyltransferase [Candidatus Nitrososphaera gargensis Ga9.2]
MTTTSSRGLMAGRFQPFHSGHLALAKQILEECDELVVVIGSAQFNFIDKDPFTAGERVLMIHEALKETGIDLAKCYVIPVPNDENNARWIAYLRSMVPSFDVLYSGNDFVKHLVLSQDPRLAVKSPKFAKKEEYNGTNIRRLMLAGGQWKRLVPPAVARVIEQVNGIERMRVLAGSDSNPQRW